MLEIRDYLWEQQDEIQTAIQTTIQIVNKIFNRCQLSAKAAQLTASTESQTTRRTKYNKLRQNIESRVHFSQTFCNKIWFQFERRKFVSTFCHIKCVFVRVVMPGLSFFYPVIIFMRTVSGTKQFHQNSIVILRYRLKASRKRVELGTEAKGCLYETRNEQAICIQWNVGC